MLDALQEHGPFCIDDYLNVTYKAFRVVYVGLKSDVIIPLQTGQDYAYILTCCCHKSVVIVRVRGQLDICSGIRKSRVVTLHFLQCSLSRRKDFTEKGKVWH